MFHIKPVKKTPLDSVIDSAISELAGHEAHTEAYAKIVSQLAELNAIKSQQKTERVSKDTLALVAGNLLGILMIVKHEELNVVTSKALSFVGKIK
jgi:FixJ family two-component response regulator